MLKTFPDLDLSDKLVIVPPGMNPDVFDLCTSIESNTTAFLKAVSLYLMTFDINYPATKHLSLA